MTEQPNVGELLAFTTEIVSAHAGNNSAQAEDLPNLTQEGFKTLSCLGGAALSGGRPRSAVSANKSIFPDYLVCLEDGKKLKMLKRHLKTLYNMTPEEYRDRWGFPQTTPWLLQIMQNIAAN
tara:strand:+ start:12642 stop:13007 length:366 start_codon:yes stop_codon:yes gene_type:complete